MSAATMAHYPPNDQGRHYLPNEIPSGSLPQPPPAQAAPSRRHAHLLPGARRNPTEPSSVSVQNHDRPSESSGKGKEKAPDWNEFYKNGLPREVIVIDDSPEPGNPAADGQAAGYHLVSTAPSQPQAKKRKYNDFSASHDTNGSGREDGPGSGTAPNGCPSLRPSASATTPQVEPNQSNTGQKRKRTRLDTATAEFKQPHSLYELPVARYRGLQKPATRAKDVALRTGHGVGHAAVRLQSPSLKPSQRALNASKKLCDDSGHYIVIPEASLTSQYTIRKLLGQGTFGKVVQAVDRDKNELVAVKIIRSVQKYRDAAKIELRVLQTLRQNDAENQYRCIHLRDCFDFHGHTCIVTDLFDASLFDFLKGNSFTPFPNSHIQSFAKQLLTSVAFLHDLNLIHTDLKPENILLRDASYQTFTYNRTIPSPRTTTSRSATQRKVLLQPEIRLIDFGSATFQDEYHSSVVSTRHYRAPEIILNLGWSYPCDIWSIGCILVEFFTGDALFQTHDNMEHMAMMETVFEQKIDPNMVRQVNKMASRGNAAASYFKRLKLCYPQPDTSRASRRFVKSMKRLEDIVPPSNSFLRQFIHLLRRMFTYDPARRITAKEALGHPWFDEGTRDDGTESARIYREGSYQLRHDGSDDYP